LTAQEPNIENLLDEPATEYAKYAFKSSRVINGQSMEMIAKGSLDFRILHSFGLLKDGYNMFGLDQASMRIGFDYGILNNLTVGIGRSTARKELDGYVKYRILHQSKGEKNMPFSLIGVAGVTMNGLKWANTNRDNLFSSRLAYYYQFIIGRKFSEAFTLQLSPTMVHQNLVATAAQANDVYALGVGGRLKITKRMALMVDYYYAFNRNITGTYNPLSFGLDIETGGHVFQLHFSNAVGMNERAFILDTNNRWGKAEIRFGFNLSRMFQLHN
jgi:hypothetical protein